MTKKTISEKPLIEVQTTEECARIAADMITVDFNLNSKTVDKLTELYNEYVLSHQAYTKIINQTGIVGPVYFALTVLKTDVEEVLQKVVSFVLNKENWVALKR